MAQEKQISQREWVRFAKACKQRREALGLSQAVVAGRLGVQGSTVHRWERGCMRPNITMRRAWDDALYAEAK